MAYSLDVYQSCGVAAVCLVLYRAAKFSLNPDV
jgi:hypothetical protein